jgi:hypothetical protein
MRSVFEASWRTGVGAAVSAPTVLGPGAAGQGGGSRGQRSREVRRRLRADQTEDRDRRPGVDARRFASNGCIIYNDTGHMVSTSAEGAAAHRNNPPTGEEAQAALRGYTAYFGSFTVNDKERDKFVIHNRFGQINPGGQKEVRRYYDFMTMPNGAERLILTPPPAEGGKDKATRRLVWQRMPGAISSGEGVRQVLARTRQLPDQDGRSLPATRRDAPASYIICRVRPRSPDEPRGRTITRSTTDASRIAGASAAGFRFIT